MRLILRQLTDLAAMIAWEYLHKNTTFSMQSMLGRMCTFTFTESFQHVIYFLGLVLIKEFLID